ncbi:T20D4.11-like domain-containing protein [Caenorhabditis elegans]|nr:DUF19 domain-containing protein [Caenorhabditis elegans]CBW48355.1 DUF19 domain-containing protein [Caenorhabditis elegans]|eukprot:NP_001256558.1 Uncharacterized protein CELE_D1086.8 [Caenorhabditis elegans]
MLYLTGGFYACSQKLKNRKDNSLCVENFFDNAEVSKDTQCTNWSDNRACLKWTIRDACGRSYWKQYKPYWHLKHSLMGC